VPLNIALPIANGGNGPAQSKPDVWILLPTRSLACNPWGPRGPCITPPKENHYEDTTLRAKMNQSPPIPNKELAPSPPPPHPSVPHLVNASVIVGIRVPSLQQVGQVMACIRAAGVERRFGMCTFLRCSMLASTFCEAGCGRWGKRPVPCGCEKKKQKESGPCFNDFGRDTAHQGRKT